MQFAILIFTNDGLSWIYTIFVSRFGLFSPVMHTQHGKNTSSFICRKFKWIGYQK